MTPTPARRPLQTASCLLTLALGAAAGGCAGRDPDVASRDAGPPDEDVADLLRRPLQQVGGMVFGPQLLTPDTLAVGRGRLLELWERSPFRLSETLSSPTFAVHVAPRGDGLLVASLGLFELQPQADGSWSSRTLRGDFFPHQLLPRADGWLFGLEVVAGIFRPYAFRSSTGEFSSAFPPGVEVLAIVDERRLALCAVDEERQQPALLLVDAEDPLALVVLDRLALEWCGSMAASPSWVVTASYPRGRLDIVTVTADTLSRAGNALLASGQGSSNSVALHGDGVLTSQPLTLFDVSDPSRPRVAQATADFALYVSLDQDGAAVSDGGRVRVGADLHHLADGPAAGSTGLSRFGSRVAAGGTFFDVDSGGHLLPRATRPGVGNRLQRVLVSEADAVECGVLEGCVVVSTVTGASGATLDVGEVSDVVAVATNVAILVVRAPATSASNLVTLDLRGRVPVFRTRGPAPFPQATLHHVDGHVVAIAPDSGRAGIHLISIASVDGNGVLGPFSRASTAETIGTNDTAIAWAEGNTLVIHDVGLTETARVTLDETPVGIVGDVDRFVVFTEAHVALIDNSAQLLARGVRDDTPFDLLTFPPARVVTAGRFVYVDEAEAGVAVLEVVAR